LAITIFTLYKTLKDFINIYFGRFDGSIGKIRPERFNQLHGLLSSDNHIFETNYIRFYHKEKNLRRVANALSIKLSSNSIITLENELLEYKLISDAKTVTSNPLFTADRSLFRYLGIKKNTVSLVCTDQKKNIWIQKRSPNKILFPNYWESTASGAIGLNETASIAIIREAKEEAKIQLIESSLRKNSVYLVEYIYEDDIVSEILTAFEYQLLDEKPVADGDEVTSFFKMPALDFNSLYDKGITVNAKIILNTIIFGFDVLKLTELISASFNEIASFKLLTLERLA